MDIKEIERLHAHYAEPTVTIELAPSGAASLGAPSALPPPHTPSGNAAVPAWARIKPIHWQGLGIVLIAALAFGGGRWLASGDTHRRSESSTAALPEAKPPAEEGGHEWPASQPSVAQPAAAEPTPVPSPSASAPAPAASSAAAAENRAKPQAPKPQAPKQNLAAPAPPRQQPASPAQTAQVTPASSRGNEIKLF